MTQNTPPMDWYPDPADPARERYWDGTQWTHNTRPVQTRPVAPGQTAVQDPWRAQDAPAQPVAGAQQPQWGPVGQAAAPTNPYAHPLAQGPRTADGVPLSGWWRRVAAWIVDGILCTLIAWLIGWKWARQIFDGAQRMTNDIVADAQAGRTTPYTADSLSKYGITDSTVTSLTMVLVAVTLAYLVLSWLLRGATPGQSLVGIRVVPTDEGRAPRRLPVARTLVRAVVLVAMLNLPYLLPLLLVATFMPLFTQRRQSIHDLLARTQVVRSR